MIGVKPCNCGGSVRVDYERYSLAGRPFWYAQCNVCYRRLGMCLSKEDAIKAWNERVSEQTADSEMSGREL